MPRLVLVLRQWQSLRGGRASRAPVRGYSTTSTARSEAFPPVRPLNSAIIIPASVKLAQLGPIVNRIEPLPAGHAAQNSFCVFLVTPSFAPWLLGESAFLASALHRVYSKNLGTAATEPFTVQTLCAIVDKLPAGRAISPGTKLEDVLEQRTKKAPSGQAGYEGIAYATFPASASVPSTSSRSSEKGAIDFILSGQPPEKALYSDIWRLPLANTVFQTGTTSTMFHATWQSDPDTQRLQLEKKTNVTHHGIDMSVSGTSSGQILSALGIPLLPLTYPRGVEGCMGNIIRRVTGPDGTSVTASSELEKVVPEFFKARGEPAQPTTVWALVVPKANREETRMRTGRHLRKRVANKEKKKAPEDVVWERLWQGERTVSNALVSKALAEGGRLHRVLSGGGGWGKKAGLLSLDPVPVDEEIPIRMEDATSGFEGPGDFSSVLTPVVQDGDAIQFFISPPPPVKVDTLEDLKSLPKERTWGWELGTVPSTVDSIPGGSWQHAETSEGYLAVFKHSFGALTEGGITLTQRRRVEPHDPLSILAKTTIDVPFSRFWSVEMAGQESSTDDTVPSPQHESERIWKIFTKEPVQQSLAHANQQGALVADNPPVSGFRVRKIAPRESNQFASTNDQLRSIVDAFRHMSTDYNNIVFTMRKRTRQIRKKPRDHQVPANTPQFSVRRFVARSASELTSRQSISNADERRHSDVADMTARMHQVKGLIVRSSDIVTHSTKHVARLTGQYKTIASEINRRTERSKAEQQSERTALGERELVFSEYLKTISKTAYEPKRIDTEGHGQTLHNLGSIERRQIRRRAEVVVRRRTAILRGKVDRSQAGVSEIQEYLRKALRHVDQLRAFTYAANHCAFDVYGLHVALRLRLGKMILYRQKRQVGFRRSKMAFGGLETRLLQLRAYDQVLFSYASVTSPQVHQKLTQLELQNEVQRSLVLRSQFGSQLREHRRLTKQRIRKTKDETDPRHTANTPALRIRYRRNRERKTVSEVYGEPRRISSLHIRFHDSKSELPIQTAQISSEPKKSERYKLWDTVSAWLEGGGIELPDTTVEQTNRPFGSRALANNDGETETPDHTVEQTKRPFGSRALANDEREKVEQGDGLALLMESAKREGRKGGRRRR